MLSAVTLLALAQPVFVRPLGTAEIQADGTGSCPGNVVETECRLAPVVAHGVEAMNFDLKINKPGGSPTKTVVFFTGGGAAGFFEGQGATAETLITDLSTTHGYTVVQAGCGFPVGASTPGCNVNMAGTGLKAAAGRVATLLNQIDATSALHTANTPLCVVGQSGGGTLVAYAIVHYGMGPKIDQVITTGGPAVTRVDYHCESRTNSEWSAICDARQLSGGGGGCGTLADFTDNSWGWNTARGDCANGSNRGAVPWYQDSVISPGADYRLNSRTKWFFIHGATDLATITVPMSRLLQDHLAAWNGGGTCASGNSWCFEETVASTGHQVAATTAGATRIIEKLNDATHGCVNR